jgi:tRNA threonylcarbamoyladenosine biosynthesis protein TsaB
MADGLLSEAGLRLGDLDALAYGRGPGSFTGVRIATAVVQGLAYGADLPVVPVSTLAALAQGHYRTRGVTRSLTAFDARMGELYWGCFALDPERRMLPVVPEQVAPAEEVALPDGNGWHGAGNGWRVQGERLKARLEGRLETVAEDLICEARDIAVLAAAEVAAGRTVPPEQALPLYLRDRVTAAPKLERG